MDLMWLIFVVSFLIAISWWRYMDGDPEPTAAFVVFGICLAVLYFSFRSIGLFKWEERCFQARAARIEKKKREEEVLRQQQAADDKRMKAEEENSLRIEKTKEFALHEAPVIWETYQRLGSEIDILSANVEKLRNVLVELGKTPEDDQDYVKLRNHLHEIDEVRKKLITKLEDACIAKAKADATPGHGDTEALWKKMQEDGIQEAKAAERRFIEIKEAK